jgi:NAD(P) transhydrogenase
MYARAAYVLLLIPRFYCLLAINFKKNTLKCQRCSISTTSVSISHVESCNWEEPINYTSLKVGVSKENGLGEKRVAVTPETALRLIKAGFSIRVEKSAGLGSSFRDSDYEAIGAKIVGFNEVWNSDIVLKVQPPTVKEAQKLQNRVVISFLQPSLNNDMMKRLAQQGATVFAMDCVPRYLSRAQQFDALSSQVFNCNYLKKG